VFQTKTDDSGDVMKQLEKDCRQNSLSLALLCMQKALLMSGSNAGAELPKNCIEVRSVSRLREFRLCRFHDKFRKKFASLFLCLGVCVVPEVYVMIYFIFSSLSLCV